MPVEMSADVEGLAELERNLALMGGSLAKGTLRAALRKVAQPIAQDAARRAPRGDGELKPTASETKRAAKKGREAKPRKRLADSIAVRSRLNKRQRGLRRRRGGDRDAAGVFIGPTVPHGHLPEFGHRIRKRDKRGFLRTVGFALPQPYLRPAWDAGRKAALEQLKPELRKAIERTARRLARQSKSGKLSKSAVRSLTS